MNIYDMALETLDQLIAKAEANKKKHTGEWWDAENYASPIPTEDQQYNKIKSLLSRLDKAKKTYFNTLTDQEKQLEDVLASWGESPENITKARESLLSSLNKDPQKYELRKAWKNLYTQYLFESKMAQPPPIGSDAAISSSLQSTHPKTYSVTVELPDRVDTMAIDGVSTLLHVACERTFGRNDFMRANCHKLGHAMLYVTDDDEQYRFNPTPIREIDFKKIRETLVGMKTEIESPEGWKRLPTAQGEVLEKITPKRTLQTEILTAMAKKEILNFSRKDSGEDPRKAAVQSEMIDKNGSPIDVFSGLTPEDIKILSEQPTGLINPEKLGITLRTGNWRLRVNAKDAQYWLGEVLGIKGLDLSPPSQSHGRRA